MLSNSGSYWDLAVDNRNGQLTKDFDSPDIVDELNKFNCRMIPRFDHGYGFLRSQLSP